VINAHDGLSKVANLQGEQQAEPQTPSTMRTIIIRTALFLVAGLFLFTTSEAQRLADDKVPQAVKKALTERFPKAQNIQWEMEGENDYEADFSIEGGNHSAGFDATGKWLETETAIKTSELPKEVMKAVETNHAGRQMKEAEQVETPDLGIVYDVELAQGTDIIEVRFDRQGNELGARKEIEKDDEVGDDKD
jgi:hypothetical protein